MVTNYFFGKNYIWLIPTSFFAVEFHNELEYCDVNAHVNIGDYSSILCENLVNICPVTLVYEAQLCTAVVNQHSCQFSCIRWGQHC